MTGVRLLSYKTLMDEYQLNPLAGKGGMPLSLRIAPELEKRLRALAKKRKVTVTSVVEVCLAAHLPELEKP